MVERRIALISSSDEAALSRLLRLVGTSRTVSVEVISGDKSFISRISGILGLGPSGEELSIRGAGSLEFELNSVSSCTFNESLSQSNPTAAEAEADVLIGVPFATVQLTNGTRIAFSRTRPI